jgi:hypothetical protein
MIKITFSIPDEIIPEGLHPEDLIALIKETLASAFGLDENEVDVLSVE